MSKLDYLPEFESQVRKAMDVPEPNANTMDTLRKQFVARGITALKTDLRFDPASNPFQPEKASKMGSGYKVSDTNCFLARLWSTINHLVTM